MLFQEKVLLLWNVRQRSECDGAVIFLPPAGWLVNWLVGWWIGPLFRAKIQLRALPDFLMHHCPRVLGIWLSYFSANPGFQRYGYFREMSISQECRSVIDRLWPFFFIKSLFFCWFWQKNSNFIFHLHHLLCMSLTLSFREVEAEMLW